MKKRMGLSAFSIFTCICLMLTGCLGMPRTETVILDDIVQEPSGQEATPFAVETIYSILEGKTDASYQLEAGVDTVYPFGWLDANSLLGFAVKFSSGEVYFSRINEPYIAEQNLYEFNTTWKNVPLSSIELSPDRSHVSYINWTEYPPELYLHSLEDGGNTRLETEIDKYTFIARMSWSNNSRFFGFASGHETSRVVQLRVYDSLEGDIRPYTIPIQQQDGYISFVAVSDNGEEAVIVKRSDQHSVLEWGRLEEGTFTVHYRHPINDEGWVEWLHKDQIAFVGADDTLYSYDRRNELLSVMLHDIRSFRLSADRKLIAYTQGDESVYAARIYGNNVLNMTPIYKGIDAHHMQWGPDNSKLLISGSKHNFYLRPLETRVQEPRASEPRAREILETINYQNLVIEFKK